LTSNIFGRGFDSRRLHQLSSRRLQEGIKPTSGLLAIAQS